VTARYLAFGSLLESDIPFPDLAPGGAGTPRWRVTRVDALPEMTGATELGRETIYEGCTAALHEHRDGLRIIVDDTGSFDLDADGTIRVLPLPTASEAFVRAHVLGRTLATALHRDGLLALHASAVLTREGVVAFLGPKGMGKSSLAAALVEAGAPLVTDDTLPCDPAPPPKAWPGVQSLRVRDDVRAALHLQNAEVVASEPQRYLLNLDATRRSARPEPLAALFLLAPAPDPHRTEPAVRTAFSPALGAAAITAHVKSGGMLGPAAATMLERSARLVHLVPVNQLSIVRDVSRLRETAQAVLGWYGGPPR